MKIVDSFGDGKFLDQFNFYDSYFKKIKNPILMTKDGPKRALNIAIENTHSALSRVISKIYKEKNEFTWNEITNQLEIPLEDDPQRLAYLNNLQLMKNLIKKNDKGKNKHFKNLENQAFCTEYKKNDLPS